MTVRLGSPASPGLAPVSRADQAVGFFRAWQPVPVVSCKPFVLRGTWPVERPPAVARYSTWW